MSNPFEYESAVSLDNETLSNYFIDTDNSNIFNSTNNVFVEGNRGSGKSMLMKYYSFQVQKLKSSIEKMNYIGVYVPCRQPFYLKSDHCFTENEQKRAIIAEHILVIGMANMLLQVINDIAFEGSDVLIINEEIKYYFTGVDDIPSLTRYLKQRERTLQEELMRDEDTFLERTSYSYLSLIDFLIETFKKTELLRDKHFMFLMDDAAMLNSDQHKTLNTWVSYRDRSDVSFKIAITSYSNYIFHTYNSNTILENHDYVTINLDANFLSKYSNYADFARKVIEKRLASIGIEKSADQFIPQSEEFTKKLDQIRNDFIQGKYPEKANFTQEQRKNNASKYYRAIYFRELLSKPKTNLPTLAYTGIDTLINISTGVIRNLLMPCFKMFEKEINANNSCEAISYQIQYRTLQEESDNLWNEIPHLSRKVPNCSNDEVQNITNIMNYYSSYLKANLLDEQVSEKRNLSFTIEELQSRESNKEQVEKIKKVIDIAVRGGLLYVRTGPGRKKQKTLFYTPNRLLWVRNGLDPVGDNGRKNFSVSDFFNIMNNQHITKTSQQSNQLGIFNDKD